MSISPKKYLDNPDALSAVLAAMQLHAQVYLNADYCGAWALDTSGSRRIPFHLVGRGDLFLDRSERPRRHGVDSALRSGRVRDRRMDRNRRRSARG